MLSINAYLIYSCQRERQSCNFKTTFDRRLQPASKITGGSFQVCVTFYFRQGNISCVMCCIHFANRKPLTYQVQPRVISFEEQVASIRQHLADIYEKKQCWRDAANVLVGIPLETGQKYKARSSN
jgi:hypothetical protein